jgi:L-aspartate oxidase
MNEPRTFDVAVIGGGAAGMHVALVAAEKGASVCFVSRKALAESASFWAQGGLAAAIGPDDSPELHAEDTLRAGRGACRGTAVEVLTAEAPDSVRELRARGVHFDTDERGELTLALEGGHSRRRIVHSGGAQTGRELTQRLSELVAADGRIELMEGVSALALWSDGERCAGVITDAGPLLARATVLATGGAAALWRRTSNPWGAIGAGMVFAEAAGADLADLEFCQFHPTALALAGSERDGYLLTEALRGEGAMLLDAAGERFTDELAPRDAVTAAILDRMDADGSDHVFLDLRRIDPQAFPAVFTTLRGAGLDPASVPVPVAPAAHYVMGGIAVDLDGRSSLGGLYAAGECACSGLHGANRLASNSLTECFVFGSRAAQAACEEPARADRPPLPKWRFEPPTEATRAALWEHAGPIRDARSLERLLDDPYPLARAIARNALARRETRGAHLRSDFPRADPDLDGVHFVHDPTGELRQESWA